MNTEPKFSIELAHFLKPENRPAFIKAIYILADNDDGLDADKRNTAVALGYTCYSTSDAVDAAAKKGTEMDLASSVTLQNRSIVLDALNARKSKNEHDAEDTTTSGFFLRIDTRYGAPFDRILIYGDAPWCNTYPNGSVIFNISQGHNATAPSSMPASTMPTFAKICANIQHQAERSKVQRDGGAVAARDATMPRSIAQLFPLVADEAATSAATAATNPLLSHGQAEGQLLLREFSSPTARESLLADDSVMRQFRQRSAQHHPHSHPHQQRYGSNASDISGGGGGGSEDGVGAGAHHQPARATPRATMAAATATTFGGMWSAAPTALGDDLDPAIEAAHGNAVLMRHLKMLEMFPASIAGKPSKQAAAVTRIVADIATCGSSSSSSSSSNASGAPVTGLVSVSFCVPVELLSKLLMQTGRCDSKHTTLQMLEGYGLSTTEQFLFAFTLNPATYPAGEISIEFGQSSNFVTRIFAGRIGQMRRVLQSFIADFFQRKINNNSNNNSTTAAAAAATSTATAKLDSPEFFESTLLDLMKDGYNVHDCAEQLRAAIDNVCIPRDPASLISSARSELMRSAVSEDRKKQGGLDKLPDPVLDGLFLGVLQVFVSKLKFLAVSCVICQREQSAVMMASSSTSSRRSEADPNICNRDDCKIKYSHFDVARDIVTATSLHTGVIDLLIGVLREAVISHRGDAVLVPYPRLVDRNGVVLCGEEKKDLGLLRHILQSFPNMSALVVRNDMQRVLDAHHPQASQLLSWVVTVSSHFTIIKVPCERRLGLAFKTCRHQFRVVMQNPLRHARFEELKRQYGSRYMFHGTTACNIWPILHGGLKNMSGTPGMLHGNAAGGRGGIYLASNPGTSVGYSGISYAVAQQQQASKIGGDDGEQFLQYSTGVRCMFLCECINHDYTQDCGQSSGVCVQPNDDHVVIRCLMVFDGPAPGIDSTAQMDTSQADVVREIETFLASV